MMIALVGWLFADLMLVIMVVTLASQPDPLADQTPRTALTRSAATSPSPSPSPSPTGKRTLDLRPVVIHIDGPGDSDQQLVAQIKAELAGEVGKQAGMVLTFGDGPCIGSDSGYAIRVNGLLGRVDPQANPPMFPPITVLRPFINGGGGGNCNDQSATGADLDIYYYTSGS
jgi:hypothetical protein